MFSFYSALNDIYFAVWVSPVVQSSSPVQWLYPPVTRGCNKRHLKRSLCSTNGAGLPRVAILGRIYTQECLRCPPGMIHGVIIKLPRMGNVIGKMVYCVSGLPQFSLLFRFRALLSTQTEEQKRQVPSPHYLW